MERTLRGESRNLVKTKGGSADVQRAWWEMGNQQRIANSLWGSAVPFRVTDALSETHCSSGLSLDWQGSILFTFKRQGFIKITCSFTPDTVFERLRHGLIWQSHGKVHTALLNYPCTISFPSLSINIHRPRVKVLFDLHDCSLTSFPISNTNSYWLSRSA